MFLAALLLAQATVPQQQCTAMDVNLPASLAAWTTPGPGNPMDVTKPITLVPMAQSDVPGLPATTKPGNAALMPFVVEKAGSYGIAVDQGAWIDVVPDGGAPLTSTKHGHGPDCSTIRKVVRFDLKPGGYTIYLSGLSDKNVRVMLVTGE